MPFLPPNQQRQSTEGKSTEGNINARNNNNNNNNNLSRCCILRYWRCREISVFFLSEFRAVFSRCRTQRIGSSDEQSPLLFVERNK